MSDKVAKEIRSRTMRAVRSKGSRIERLFFAALKVRGIRFRKNVISLFGKPDIASNKYKLAIFIDSCFWHGCRYHCRRPQSNQSYWLTKIEKNKERDRDVRQWYRKKGWTILRFWEHEIDNNLEKCITKVVRLIQSQVK